MRYLTRWRSRRKAPIVAEKYQAPDPGETNQATQSDTFSGPPAIHATWFNVHDRSDFRNISISLPASIDKITIAIGNHVRDGVYSIVSMSASAYSITVVCSTEKSRAEVAELVQRMKEELGQNAVIPPEELVLLREWEEKWGVVEELSTMDDGLDTDVELDHRVLSASQSSTAL
ncbi:hypothetical protein BDV27DRAFT_132759 [Aspergillus caelatus]|uniref:Uncharacterized protein n=2 Tax=Aspergillus subgen. Circumdati TaxID=2720871 RepID=A0A5N6ZXD8_9EURO|nr:uncharacterized protein BDV27DRAFT_132759 [Aspergillus caelatus]KAE8361596.1 hypothetical protein BDV27DRAFT_132759 [Aspergillus caelatus]KAE8413631.1 hypothetical protein BDV36DRAFT_267981 [Aspergillus pseudocaelatus]